MTWLDTAKRGTVRPVVIFRGTFASSAAVAWATQDVSTSAGAIKGRILSVSPIVRGISDSPGGAPERVSTSIVLDNSDHALDAWAIGTTGAASLEYRSDGFLNLTGQFHLALVNESGLLVEETLTPTLYCSGSLTSSGLTLSVPLASRDDDVIGRIVPLVTLGAIREADATGNVAGGSMDSGGISPAAVTYESSEWINHRRLITEGYEQIAPIVYGRTLISANPAGDRGSLPWLVPVCVSVDEPSVLTFGGLWQDGTGQNREKWTLYEMIEGVRVRRAYDGRQCKVELDATDADGDAITAWFSFVLIDRIYGAEDLERSDFVFDPDSAFTFSAGTSRTLSRPSDLVRWMVSDLSEGGSARIDSASFDRAAAVFKLSAMAGGVIRQDVTLAEIIEHISRAFGLELYITKADDLAVLTHADFSEADRATVAGNIPHLTAAEITGWTETIPRDSDAQGAAVSRVYLDWTGDQAQYWQPWELLGRAPGATQLAISGSSEARISAAWLYPPGASLAMESLAGRLAHVARRFEFVAPLWVAAYEIGSFFRISHFAGLQPGGAGYAMRLARLERLEIIPDEAAARCVFEDMGPLEATKSAVLDTITNWIRYDPTGTGQTCALVNGSQTVNFSAALTGANAPQVGDHLWTFGASAGVNRRSKRITAVNSTTQVTVEFPAGGTQTITASAGGTAAIDTAWIIVRTQSTKSPTNTTKITLCNEATSNFRDGVTTGFQVL